MKKAGKVLVSILLGIINMISSVTSFSAALPFLIGDVDFDGEISIVDATFIQRYLASLYHFTKHQVFAGDVDGDGDTTILDATNIQRELAGLPNNFYQKISYDVYPGIINVFADYDSGKAMTGVAVTFGVTAEGKRPITYSFSVDGVEVQKRSENSKFTYTFSAAGKYLISTTVYNSIDDEEHYEMEYEVVDMHAIDTPTIVSAYFDTLQNRYSSSTVTVNAVGGTAPYQYQYSVYGGEISSDANLGDYSLQGNTLVQSFSEKNTTVIPTEALTYGKDYILKIEVRDSLHSVSEPVYLHFNNSDIPE